MNFESENNTQAQKIYIKHIQRERENWKYLGVKKGKK